MRELNHHGKYLHRDAPTTFQNSTYLLLHHLFDADTDDIDDVDDVDDVADDEDVHREEDAGGADSCCWCACPSLGEAINAGRRVFAPLVAVTEDNRSLAAEAAPICRAKTSTNAVNLTSLAEFMSLGACAPMMRVVMCGMYVYRPQSRKHATLISTLFISKTLFSDYYCCCTRKFSTISSTVTLKNNIYLSESLRKVEIWIPKTRVGIEALKKLSVSAAPATRSVLNPR